MSEYKPGSIHNVQPVIGPDGLDRYFLTINPTDPDPNRLYGAQGGIDIFWPINDRGERTTLTDLPEPVNGEVWITGILGDPDEKEAAILVGTPTRREFGLRAARLIELSEPLKTE